VKRSASKAATAISLVAACFAGWFIRQRNAPQSVSLLDAESSMVTVLMLLLSPIVWDHYLVLLILPLFLLGERSLCSDPSWLGMFCLFGVILVLSIR
jgi:hypothetical protein